MLSLMAEKGLGWHIPSNSGWKSCSALGFMEGAIVTSFDHSCSRAQCGRAHRYRAFMSIADELPDLRKNEVTAGEVLDIFFPSNARNGEARRYETQTQQQYKPPTYALREQTGREAQGFMNADPLALRTLAPVRELTYGEYNLSFFFSLVDECLSIRAGGSTGRTTMESQARCENYHTGADMGLCRVGRHIFVLPAWLGYTPVSVFV